MDHTDGWEEHQVLVSDLQFTPSLEREVIADSGQFILFFGFPLEGQGLCLSSALDHPVD